MDPSIPGLKYSESLGYYFDTSDCEESDDEDYLPPSIPTSPSIQEVTESGRRFFETMFDSSSSFYQKVFGHEESFEKDPEANKLKLDIKIKKKPLSSFEPQQFSIDNFENDEDLFGSFFEEEFEELEPEASDEFNPPPENIDLDDITPVMVPNFDDFESVVQEKNKRIDFVQERILSTIKYLELRYYYRDKIKNLLSISQNNEDVNLFNMKSKDYRYLFDHEPEFDSNYINEGYYNDSDRMGINKKNLGKLRSLFNKCNYLDATPVTLWEIRNVRFIYMDESDERLLRGNINRNKNTNRNIQFYFYDELTDKYKYDYKDHMNLCNKMDELGYPGKDHKKGFMTYIINKLVKNILDPGINHYFIITDTDYVPYRLKKQFNEVHFISNQCTSANYYSKMCRYYDYRLPSFIAPIKSFDSCMFFHFFQIFSTEYGGKFKMEDHFFTFLSLIRNYFKQNRIYSALDFIY